MKLNPLTTLLALAAAGALAHAGLAADDPPTPPSETKKPATPPPTPSLDDLLGTGGEKKPAAEPAAKPGDPLDDLGEALDPSRADLDRLLSGEELSEAFQQAVALMGDAAGRLERAQDPGITTQRVQEDVLRRLDQLLASLERRPSPSSSSSSSSSSQQRDSQASRNTPNQRRPAQSGQNTPTPGSGEPGERAEAPGRQDGPLRPGLDSARAAWGALPERIRDMLLQGSSDRFSARYRAMTEAYYKRLAEEKK